MTSPHDPTEPILPRRLELRKSPEQAVASWPTGQPLAALVSGGQGSERSRWSILGRPSRRAAWCPERAEEARRLLREMATGGAGAADRGEGLPPFWGGRIVAVSYELGRVLEPKAGTGQRGATGTLIHELVCDDALIFDHEAGVWWAVGEPPRLLEGARGEGFEVAPLASEVSLGEYERGVERILEYIRSGDVYQVNLAHRMTAEFSGSTRAFFTALMRAAGAWYGAYLETGEGVIASASPEMFLSYDPVTRRLTTRPMKGTRPIEREKELRASEKDAAELNMITDLMRNDLGRVCELGSVVVGMSRVVERHNRLAQTTSTVSGLLRAGLNAGDALASAFPGGSVTGCPKIRAMQVIEELEASPRGFYCGSIGYFSRSGHAAFNIAIRTATIRGSRLSYHAGAGIVIDSNPAAEWQETLDKAGIMSRVAEAAGRGEHDA